MKKTAKLLSLLLALFMVLSLMPMTALAETDTAEAVSIAETVEKSVSAPEPVPEPESEPALAPASEPAPAQEAGAKSPAEESGPESLEELPEGMPEEPAADGAGSREEEESVSGEEPSPETDGESELDDWALLAFMIAAAEDGDVLTLERDFHCDPAATQYDYPLTVLSGSLTIDLNGHTIDRGLSEDDPREFGCVIYVGGGSLTITDSSADKSGVITGGYSTVTGGGGVHVERGAVFVFEGGNISGNVSETEGGGVYVNYGGYFDQRGAISSRTTAPAAAVWRQRASIFLTAA